MPCFRVLISTSPPFATVKTSDEVGHWLVGSSCLHLEETRLLRAALETSKEAFFVALAVLLLLPVGSASFQVLLLSLATLILLRLTSKLVRLHFYDIRRCEVAFNNLLSQLWVFVIFEVVEQ